MMTYSVTVPSKINSLQVYSLAASEPNIAPNKPRNFLWSADVNIDASLHLVILFKSMHSTGHDVQKTTNDKKSFDAGQT